MTNKARTPNTVLVWCDREQAPTTADVDKHLSEVARCRSCGRTDHPQGDGTEFPFAYLDDSAPAKRLTIRKELFPTVFGNL